MLFTPILAVAAMVGSALAGFDIKTGQQTWYYTDDAEVRELLRRSSQRNEC
jgi:hypothetical protein